MQERRARELQQEALRADLEKQVVEKRLAKAIALAELKMDDLNLLRDCERKNVDEWGREVVPGSPIAAARGRALKKAEAEYEAWAHESDVNAQAREQAEEEALRKAEVAEERERQRRERLATRSTVLELKSRDSSAMNTEAAGYGGVSANVPFVGSAHQRPAVAAGVSGGGSGVGGGGRLSPVSESEYTPRDRRIGSGHGPASSTTGGVLDGVRFGGGGTDDSATQVSQVQLEDIVTSLRDMQDDYHTLRQELDDMTARALRGGSYGDAGGDSSPRGGQGGNRTGDYPRSARRGERPQKPTGPARMRGVARQQQRDRKRHAQSPRARGTIAQAGRNRPAQSGRPVFVTRDERDRRAVALRRHVQASNARVGNYNDPRVSGDRGKEWVPGRPAKR